MAETTITKKGQVVIPSAIRKRRNLEGGQKLSVTDEGEKIVLIPIRTLSLEQARGSLKIKKPTAKLLKELREKDTKREAKLVKHIKNSEKKG